MNSNFNLPTFLFDGESYEYIRNISKGEYDNYIYGYALTAFDGSITYSNKAFDLFVDRTFDLSAEPATVSVLSKKINFVPTSFSLVKSDNLYYFCYTACIDHIIPDCNHLVAVCSLDDILHNMHEGMLIQVLLALVNLRQSDIDNNFIFDSLFDLLTVTDGSGTIIKTNSAIEKQFGIKKSDAIGSSVFNLENDGVLSKSVTKEVLKTKKPLSIIQDTQTGQRLLVSSTPIFDSNGKIEKIFNISKDVTTISTLENKLQEAEKLINEYEKQSEMQTKLFSSSNKLITSNITMQQTIDTVNNITNIDSTILIEGETGVGKGVMARTIHDTSKNSSGPFVKINCGAIPDNLIESELFGYEKGAFTGAIDKGKAGLVAAAENGTLFLDEIEDMPLNMQVKILDLIQTKEYYPVGSSVSKQAHIRIIAATNKNLQEMVANNTFREDLYYRLHVIPLYIPPLRERRSEIPILTNQFMQKYCKMYHLEKHLSKDALDIIANANWPGNIRELENMIERLVVTTKTYIITPDDIPEDLKVCDSSIEAIEVKFNRITTLKEAQDKVTIDLINEALRHSPNKSDAAELLGIHRTTLSRLLSGKKQINHKTGEM